MVMNNQIPRVFHHPLDIKLPASMNALENDFGQSLGVWSYHL